MRAWFGEEAARGSGGVCKVGWWWGGEGGGWLGGGVGVDDSTGNDLFVVEYVQFFCSYYDRGGGGGDTFLADIFSNGGGRGCDVWMGEGSWVGSRVLEYMIAPEKLFVIEVVEIVFLVSTMVEGDTFFAHIFF